MNYKQDIYEFASETCVTQKNIFASNFDCGYNFDFSDSPRSMNNGFFDHQSTWTYPWTPIDNDEISYNSRNGRSFEEVDIKFDCKLEDKICFKFDPQPTSYLNNSTDVQICTNSSEMAPNTIVYLQKEFTNHNEIIIMDHESIKAKKCYKETNDIWEAIEEDLDVSNDTYVEDSKKTSSKAKSRRSKIDLCKRKDVLNKGSLRLLRKSFRHLFAILYEHKRKRTKYTKMKQFEGYLKQFVGLIYNESVISVNKEEIELLGRLLNDSNYELLPSEYLSSNSQYIKQFVESYDKCWVSYSHLNFKSLIRNEVFKSLFNIYDRLKALGLLEQHGLHSDDNNKYEKHIMSIRQIVF